MTTQQLKIASRALLQIGAVENMIGTTDEMKTLSRFATTIETILTARSNSNEFKDALRILRGRGRNAVLLAKQKGNSFPSFLDVEVVEKEVK